MLTRKSVQVHRQSIDPAANHSINPSIKSAVVFSVPLVAHIPSPSLQQYPARRSDIWLRIQDWQEKDRP